MENKKPDNIKLNERDKFHEKLMESILKNLSDTPLVLKGGSALYLGYGLNRFSEDLDFDSLKKLNHPLLPILQLMIYISRKTQIRLVVILCIIIFKELI